MIAIILSLAAMTGCAVDQGAHASLRRELPDGSVVVGEFERKWAAGPVEVEAEYDPATGRWLVKWRSDVDLGPAERATAAQIEAQTRLIENLAELLRVAASAAAVTAPPVSRPPLEIEVPRLIERESATLGEGTR